KKLKAEKAKIDENNIKYQSQQYTPDWVVKYIVDNTLGKYYLEMHPDSKLYEDLDIPIAKKDLKVEREKKSIEDIRLLDPACGSGNFLIYAFDLFYKMYKDQGYSEDEIPNLILQNNLYGIDIDERAIQLTVLNLYLKVFDRTKKFIKCSLNVASADFNMFNGERLQKILSKYNDGEVKDFITTIWDNLKNAKKFGSLLNINYMFRKFKEASSGSKPLLFDENNWKKREIEILESIKGFIINEKIYGQNIAQGMNFAEIIVGEYDIVVANPPYLDSSDMTDEYKKFVKDNYKDFDKNLYASFIKRCTDFAKFNGYIGMITPQTFMFISSYERMRKWILKNLEIKSFVHFGLGGVFEDVLVDTSMFILSKQSSNNEGIYFKLDEFKNNDKRNNLKDGLLKLKNEEKVEYVFKLNQSKFLLIPDSPFVYWISDKIRNLFVKYQPLEKYAEVVQGLATANNDRFLRYWWEVNEDDISKNYASDRKKWVMYAKGGPYNKWYGNLWWVVNWGNNGKEIRDFVDETGRQKSRPQNESYYFKEGLTYSFISSLGFTTRYLPSNCIFDVIGSSMFPKGFISEYLVLMNSKLFSYIMNVLNPTAAFQVGDLKNIPIPDLDSKNSSLLQILADDNIEIKKTLYSFHVIERDFKHDPVSWGLELLNHNGNVSRERIVYESVRSFFIKKAELEARLLLNEAKIDEEVFRLYGLLPESYSILDAVISAESGSVPEDLEAVVEVLSSEGIPAGIYPDRELTNSERAELKRIYLNHRHDRGSGKSEAINGMEFGIVEEISSKIKVSPLRVVEEIKKIDDLPGEAVKDVISEHIQAMVIEIMRESNNGIVALDPLREKSLFEILKEKWKKIGIEDYYDDLEKMLGIDIDKYLLTKFFGDHAKRFKNRPIVWHILSDSKDLNFFVLHHTWSGDKLLLIKSQYLSNAKSILNVILSSETDEKKRSEISDKLREIDRMEKKIDSLLKDGYDPKVDDGVAKNLAYLQKYDLVNGKPLSDDMVKKMAE
ncbi:MAG: BREX-1 system adenine-specific DNA-methyltransferase PglX, partial [Thermodesulfobium sp.]